jgi:hypothetical protein
MNGFFRRRLLEFPEERVAALAGKRLSLPFPPRGADTGPGAGAQLLRDRGPRPIETSESSDGMQYHVEPSSLSPARSRCRWLLRGAALLALVLGGFAASGTAQASSAPVVHSRATNPALQDGKKHQHSWVSKTRKVWVPPQYKNEVVGTDDKGKPIIQKKMIKPGYWKTEVYQQCSCGATKG